MPSAEICEIVEGVAARPGIADGGDPGFTRASRRGRGEESGGGEEEEFWTCLDCATYLFGVMERGPCGDAGGQGDELEGWECTVLDQSNCGC